MNNDRKPRHEESHVHLHLCDLDKILCAIHSLHTISPEDQSLLNVVEARASRQARRVTALDARTPPKKK